ncbi:MAG: glycosyltransferase [Alphaproteobacteria bacterium]
MSVIVALAVAGWVFATSAQIMATVFGLIAQRRRKPQPTSEPAYTILMPVLSVDYRFEDAFRSVLVGYRPNIELIVASENPHSPALALARSLAAEHAVPISVYTGRAGLAASPKLDALIEAIRGAKHDLMVIKDSNIVLDPKQLDEVAGLLTGSVGLVSAIPIIEDVRNFGAEVERSTLNGFHARTLKAGALFGYGAGIGKVMMFRRSDLEKAGGLAAISGTIAEDHAMAKVLTRIGLKPVMAPSFARQPVGERKLRDVFARQLRWMTIRRREVPLAFLAEPFVCSGYACLCATIAAPALGISPFLALGGTLAFHYALEAAYARSQGWPIGPQAFAAWILREIVNPVLWVRAWFTREVVWGGRRIDAVFSAGGARQ